MAETVIRAKRARITRGHALATTGPLLDDALNSFVKAGGDAKLVTMRPSTGSHIRVGFFFIMADAAATSTPGAVGSQAAAVLLVAARRVEHELVAPRVGTAEWRMLLTGGVELLAVETLMEHKRRGCARALATALQACMRPGTNAISHNAACMVGHALQLWEGVGFTMCGVAPGQPLPAPGSAGAEMPAAARATTLSWTCPRRDWQCNALVHSGLPVSNSADSFHCRVCSLRRGDMPLVFREM